LWVRAPGAGLRAAAWAEGDPYGLDAECAPAVRRPRLHHLRAAVSKTGRAQGSHPDADGPVLQLPRAQPAQFQGQEVLGLSQRQTGGAWTSDESAQAR